MELENTLQNIALVILVIAIIYLLYKSNQENFADTPTLTLDSIKDEINKQYNLDIEAIRNLGAISKSLMTGTNYISTKTDGKPGDLTIPADNTSFSGNVNMDGNLNVKGGTISTPNKLQINGNDSLVLLNKNGVVISKASNGNGNLTVDGDTVLTGTLNITSGIISSSGKQKINGESLSILNKNGVVVSKDAGGNGKLTVDGDFILNTLYRKNMPAGYYHIKAYGRSTELRYGWTILWDDGNTFNIMSRLLLYEKNRGGSCNQSHHDMRAGNDGNWWPRKLIVFPGYKVTFYYYNYNYVSKASDTFTTSQDWTSKDFVRSNDQSIHLINVIFDNEQPNYDITCDRLTDYNWNVGVFPSMLNDKYVNRSDYAS